MFIQHTKMICDPIELYEARLLEMPMINSKPDFKEIDFATYWKLHREFIRASKLARKIIKFNKI